MLINASKKDFTPIHLVTFRMNECMNEQIVKYKVATSHYIELCHVIA